MVSVVALVGSQTALLAADAPPKPQPCIEPDKRNKPCIEPDECKKPEPMKTFDLRTNGYLTFGLRAGEEDARLSDAAADREHEFFADTELSFKADFAPNKSYCPPCGKGRLLFHIPDKFGAEIQLQADADIDDINVDEAYLYLEDRFGKIELGRNDGAEEFMALGADTIATGTGGINGDFENLGTVDITDSGDAAKITYLTPQFRYRKKTPEEKTCPNDDKKKKIRKLLWFGVSYTPDTGDERVEEADDPNARFEDLENHLGVGAQVFLGTENNGTKLSAVGSFGNSEDSERRDLNAFAFGVTREYKAGPGGLPGLEYQGFDALKFGASYGNNHGPDDLQFVTAGITLSLAEKQIDLLAHNANVGLGYNFVDKDDDERTKTHIVALSGEATVYEGTWKGWNSTLKLQADLAYSKPESESSDVAGIVAIRLAF